MWLEASIPWPPLPSFQSTWTCWGYGILPKVSSLAFPTSIVLLQITTCNKFRAPCLKRYNEIWVLSILQKPCFGMGTGRTLPGVILRYRRHVVRRQLFLMQWECDWLMLQRCPKGLQDGWGQPPLCCALCETPNKAAQGQSHGVTYLGTRNCLLRSTNLPILVTRTLMKGILCSCSPQAFKSLCPWNHKSLHPWIKSSTRWLKPEPANAWKFKCWAPVNMMRYSQKEKYRLLFPELFFKPHPFIKALKSKPLILSGYQSLALKFPTPCDMLSWKWTRPLGSTG